MLKAAYDNRLNRCTFQINWNHVFGFQLQNPHCNDEGEI